MATTKFNGTVNATTGFQVNGVAVPAPLNSASLVDVTSATVSLTAAAHAGKLVTLTRAAGIAVTLPAATGSGNVYRLLVAADVTSNSTTIKVANSSDTMQGFVLSTLAAGGTTFGETAGGTDDTITMNGSTLGGLAGSYVELVDRAANLWFVRGFLAGSGTLASTLSATV
jgi:hypothetical protein